MSHKAKPPHRNPALPDFWDQRFRNKTTPWDAGGVPTALKDFAASRQDQPRVLIPGCGSAYEARFLAELGWQVTALDFSVAAIEAARVTLGPHADRLLLADFFTFDAGDRFDLIYERAFLCALPRHLWRDYAARVAELLKPGGLLVGFFFFSDDAKGPPFGTSPRELEQLFSPRFKRLIEQEVDDSIPVFQGKERWQIWRRDDDSHG